MKRLNMPSALGLLAGALGACGSVAAPPASVEPGFQTTVVTTFIQPWAMSFLPDGRALVTLKTGELLLINQAGETLADVQGVPAVEFGGQGGLGDVVLHPDFAENRQLYLSYAEAGSGKTRGAAVARATLTETETGAELSELKVIWRQSPKVTGRGHFGHRLAFSEDGYLYISSGDRQKFDPAQDLKQSLGKVLRLNADGSVPDDNPFSAQAGVAAEVWSYGHRNPLGLAFDSEGQLWNTEMGPRHGDELNRVVRGANYGYPIVSNGDHYSGKDIPDHSTRPEFVPPAAYWVPAISPGSLMIYSGDLFPEYKGNAFIGGLSSQALVRVALSGSTAKEVERFAMGNRIREVEQGPNGAIWLLEDGGNGRLLKLTPR
ncbi:MAG: PQQ-dependent sugar dehydrogenase [Pseudomonadota bacterium]